MKSLVAEEEGLENFFDGSSTYIGAWNNNFHREHIEKKNLEIFLVSFDLLQELGIIPSR